jgi:hypothetical protein
MSGALQVLLHGFMAWAGTTSFLFFFYKSCTKFQMLHEDCCAKYIVLVSVMNHHPQNLILQAFINKMSEEINVTLFFILKPVLLGKRRGKKGKWN